MKEAAGFKDLHLEHRCVIGIDQCPNKLNYSRAQLNWVSRGVLVPFFYGTSLSKFEDNSTELFNRVTVK